MNTRSVTGCTVDVVIVGAGPVGLTLANLLGVYGVETLLIERSAELLGMPRAVSLDDEGMRVLQMAGLVEPIAPHLLMGYDHWLHGRNGQILVRVDPASQEFGFPKRNCFHQPIVEAALLRGLERFTHVRTKFQLELTGYEVGESDVRVALAGPQGETAISARYLVGADGGGSLVRQIAGIAMEGLSHAEPWIVIDTENNDDVARYSRVFADPVRPSVSVPGTEGRRRYEFMLLPGEDPVAATSVENVRALLARHCDVDRITVTRSVVYTFHSLVAERFSDQGRVFLAGDAAHMMPPFQGQGMNSGLRDAALLAWRLAAVVQGQARGSAFLQSYEDERRPHAQDMVVLSQRVGRILMTRSRTLAVLRDAAFSLASIWPWARRYLRSMGFKPRPKAESGCFVSSPGSIAGAMLPQPDVLLADGTTAQLDRVLGPGWSLIQFADRAADAQWDEAALWRRLAPSRVVVVPGGVERSAGAVTVIGDIGGILRCGAGAAAGEILVVRPDRYVAAVIPAGDDGAMTGRLAELLGLGEPDTAGQTSGVVAQSPIDGTIAA